MHSFRKLISLLLVAAMLFSLSCEAFAVNAGDEEASFDDDPAPAGSGNVLTLPAALTVIEEEAFCGDESIEDVVIPYGATTIGPRAFAYSGLKRITIPDTVVEIADDAFEGTDGLTIVAPVDSYAREYAEAHGVGSESDGAHYVNEELAARLALTEGHDDLETLLPEDLDFTLESTKGVTDPVLLDLLRKHNKTQTALKQEHDRYSNSLNELAAGFNELSEGVLNSGVGVSSDSATLEISGVNYHYNAEIADIFGDDYSIVSTSVLDNGNLSIEIISDGQTFILEGSGEDLTLVKPNGNRIRLGAVHKGIIEDSLSALRNAVTDIKNYCDGTLAGISSALDTEMASLRASIDMEEELAAEISSSLRNIVGVDNQSRARNIQNVAVRNAARYRASLRTLAKISSWISGISTAINAYSLSNDLKRLTKLQEIRSHSHPTDTEILDDDIYAIAMEMTQDLTRAWNNYTADAVTTVLSITLDITNLISTVSIVLPGGLLTGAVGRLGTLIGIAGVKALNIALCAAGIVSGSYADAYFSKVETAEKILHSPTLAGTVTEYGTNEKLSGVTVTLDDSSRSFITLTDGTYTFPSVVVGEHSLRFKKDGYEEILLKITVTDPAEPVDQEMRSEPVTLSGTISDEITQAKFSGIVVTLDGSMTTITDAGGKYSFSDVSIGDHHLALSVTGYKSIAKKITVTREKTIFDFTLEEDPSSLSGLITDSKTGAALSGVKVTLTTPLDGSFVTYTDASGVYSFTNVPYDTHGIRFEKAGYETKTGKVTMALIGNTKYNVKLVQQEEDPDFDPEFWAWCVTQFDQNQDKTLSSEEILAVTEMDCPELVFTSLAGVQYFSNLRTLYCSSNPLTSLDLSGCSALVHLSCGYNQLTSLNLSGCSALVRLYCPGNQLTSLNLSGCSALEDLGCSFNDLTSLNLSGCSALRRLNCYNNQLTSLDLRSCPNCYVYCESSVTIIR